MPRRCSICDHKSRADIDAALVAGGAYRSIAKQYGASESAMYRHKAEHLPAKLVMAQAAEEVAQADELLGQIQDLQARTLAILEAAEETKQHRTALAAIKEARGNLELLAKLLGELDARPVVNLSLSPEWLEMRAAIVVALEPYGEAKEAVLKAIGGTENGRA